MPKLISSKLIFIFLLCFSFAFFIHATQAASITFQPQVPDKTLYSGITKITNASIGILISNIYKYATGVVGILAAVVLMFGGILWLTAGGNPTQIGEAKAWIMGALSGLVIVMTAYLILYVVNPALVTFPELSIKPVGAPKAQTQEDQKTIDENNKRRGSCTTTGAATSCSLCCNLDTCIPGFSSVTCK
jgi:hypothetical protein